MLNSLLTTEKRRHGPPYKAEAVAAYDPGVFPARLLGYQVAICDALDHIIYVCLSQKIFASKEEAMSAWGDKPTTFKDEGFDRGNATAEFELWSGFYISGLI